MMSLPDDLHIDQASYAEANMLMQWAVAEGWNPGLHDLDAAWAVDPDAFIALRHQGRMVGGGSIFSHHGESGYMGLFIVEPSCRGKGWGTVLWHHRLARLRKRLRPGAPISMAGVHAMVDFYQKGGFVRQYDDIRYQGIVRGHSSPDAVPLSDLSSDDIHAFDRTFVTAPRAAFLAAWLPHGQGVGIMRGKRLVAYGLIRPANHGYKVGPAFAIDESAGVGLLDHLFSMVSGHVVQVDIPSANLKVQPFLDAAGLVPVFSCAHLVHPNGNQVVPELPAQHIYGVTSLEFG
jgi:GNAT superfamily N-acetyltransferase